MSCLLSRVIREERERGKKDAFPYRTVRSFFISLISLRRGPTAQQQQAGSLLLFVYIEGVGRRLSSRDGEAKFCHDAARPLSLSLPLSKRKGSSIKVKCV